MNSIDDLVTSSFPSSVNAWLKEPCPIYKDKTVAETHFVFNILESNKHLYTLTNTEKLVKEKYTIGYRSISDRIIDAYANNSPAKAGYIAITKTALPESQNKSFDDQLKIIETLNKKTGLDYQVPQLPYVVAGLFAQYIRSGEYLYDEISTNCQETLQEYQLPGYHLYVQFSKDGLHIGRFMYKGSDVGMGAMRFISS